MGYGSFLWKPEFISMVAHEGLTVQKGAWGSFILPLSVMILAVLVSVPS